MNVMVFLKFLSQTLGQGITEEDIVVTDADRVEAERYYESLPAARAEAELSGVGEGSEPDLPEKLGRSIGEALEYLARTTEDATQNSLEGEQLDDDKVEANR